MQRGIAAVSVGRQVHAIRPAVTVGRADPLRKLDVVGRIRTSFDGTNGGVLDLGGGAGNNTIRYTGITQEISILSRKLLAVGGEKPAHHFVATLHEAVRGAAR